MTTRIATMKKNINGHVFRLCLLILGLQLFQINILPAQDTLSTSGYTFSLDLKEVKNSDGSRTYTSKLEGSGDEGSFPVYQAEISLLNEALILGSGKTDKDGNIVITLGPDTKYKKDQAGVITVKSLFNGSGDVEGAEASVSFMDLDLQMNLEEKDSSRTILVTANSVDANNELIPLNEISANVYIQGLYSKLKIGDCFFENGLASFTFPGDLPGDENGVLKVFVRIEENETYGDVEKTEVVKWGQHRSGYIEPSRSLWSSGAPLWMIVTLTILLVGVWSHYLFAVIQIIKIRKEGKSLESK